MVESENERGASFAAAGIGGRHKARRREKQHCQASWGSPKDVPAINAKKVWIGGQGPPLGLRMVEQLGQQDAAQLAGASVIGAGVVDNCRRLPARVTIIECHGEDWPNCR